MNAQELIIELSRQGVIIEAIADELRINAPKGVLTAELCQALVEQKQALLTLLQMPPAPCGRRRGTHRTAVAAPAIQEAGQKEKELDELIAQLRAVGRSHKIEWARRKRVPLKALIHASTLWLKDDPDDWTAANDTIFQFTSPFGNKQLCYRRSEKVAIPEMGGKGKMICSLCENFQNYKRK
jgi:hypothetical protein